MPATDKYGGCGMIVYADTTVVTPFSFHRGNCRRYITRPACVYNPPPGKLLERNINKSRSLSSVARAIARRRHVVSVRFFRYNRIITLFFPSRFHRVAR